MRRVPTSFTISDADRATLTAIAVTSTRGNLSEAVRLAIAEAAQKRGIDRRVAVPSPAAQPADAQHGK